MTLHPLFKHKNYPPVRSYVQRAGRMTPAQMRGLANLQDVSYFNSSELLNTTSPIILEIGFGMGDSLIAQAQSYPQAYFMGIEVHKPGIGRLLSRIEKEKITNLRVICQDAVEILNHKNMIPDNSLDKIQIFFPDPWQKTRHHKRRLIQPDFVKTCYQKLKSQGILHIATDWENYAQYIQQIFSTLDLVELFKLNPARTDFYARPATKFELRGKKLGHAVWDFVFEAKTVRAIQKQTKS